MANPLVRVPPRMLPQNFWVHSLLLSLGPQAIRKGWEPPEARRKVAMRRYPVAYPSPVMLPPQPQFSLPTPQYFTLKGSGDPLAARSSESELPLGRSEEHTSELQSPMY